MDYPATELDSKLEKILLELKKYSGSYDADTRRTREAITQIKDLMGEIIGKDEPVFDAMDRDVARAHGVNFDEENMKRGRNQLRRVLRQEIESYARRKAAPRITTEYDDDDGMTFQDWRIENDHE
jgi:hypothetical protein